MNIFNRMKRVLILAMLMTSMLAAKAGHHTTLLMPPLTCTELSALPSPAASIESNTQVAIIIPAFTSLKQIPGTPGAMVTITAAPAMHRIFVLRTSDGRFSKNYLSHIYPLLHLW